MRSRMKQKMIIFQKSNHTDASTKIVHFYFPFSEPISSSTQTVVNHTLFPHIVPTNYMFPLSTHIQLYGTKDKKGCCPKPQPPSTAKRAQKPLSKVMNLPVLLFPPLMKRMPPHCCSRLRSLPAASPGQQLELSGFLTGWRRILQIDKSYFLIL